MYYWLILLLLLSVGWVDGQKTKCRNIRTTFNTTSHGWKMESTLPYNSHMGHGPTLNSSTYMHYGRLSATIKSSKVGGAITAVILISDSGDEIDFEVIGLSQYGNTVLCFHSLMIILRTNYFWGNHPLYTINGGSHDIQGENTYDVFHTYSIDWQLNETLLCRNPEHIVWAVDGKAIRIKNRDETCDEQGCKFPSTPARIQIGFWDGSFEFGTAEWSHGPIDWEKHVDTPITSYLKEIAVECNPEYNEIVHELPSEEETETLEPSLPGENGETGSNSPTKWKPKPSDDQQQQQQQSPQEQSPQEKPNNEASIRSHFTLIPLSIITFTLAVLMG
ncbi:concanavalin A-like lectin/glucanase [Lichtheimia hyalospora FSU 10163]|nr:concanavalin A-like lectin/glucanase [Lichtheimia hyalospora FSU 10163]